MDAKTNGSLPAVQTRLHLRDGEFAVYEADATLYELKAVRIDSYTSTRELRPVDNGTLTVTTKRIQFHGSRENRNTVITKILSTSIYQDAVEINIENRQKALVFSARNPALLDVIVELCITLA